MKKKLIIIILILVLMLGIPLFTTNNMIINDIKNNYLVKENTKASTNAQLSDKETIYCIVSEKYRDEYCDETIKAMTIILYSNYKIKPDKYKLNGNYKEEYVKKYSENKFHKLTNTIDKVYGNIITYKNKPVYIPLCYKSAGFTESSKEYPYIKNAASPWDNTKSNNKVCVSLNGINNLCKKAYSYKEAMAWYLKNVKIVNYNSKLENKSST
ncbi:MAG: hypothetical protein ACI4HO_04700 [Ruminococcus sp.]